MRRDLYREQRAATKVADTAHTCAMSKISAAVGMTLAQLRGKSQKEREQLIVEGAAIIRERNLS